MPGSAGRDATRRVTLDERLNCAAVSWIFTLWDRSAIRRTMYAASFLVLFLGLVVFLNNRNHSSAATGPVVPGSPSQLQLDYGSAIPFPKAAASTARSFILGAVLRKDLSAAWADSIGSVHGSLTRAQWMTGNIPVSPFPASAYGGTKYKIEHSRQKSVLLLVSIGSIKADVRFQEFFLELVPNGGTWKVDYFGPRGTNPPVPADRAN